MEKHCKTPLFHVSRRLNISKKKAFVVRLSTIVGGIILCALVCSFFKFGTFFKYFENLFTSLISFQSSKPLRSFVNTLEEMALLLGIALALLPAFKMKYWNLGAEGQVLMGGFAAATVSKFLPNTTPQALAIVLMMGAGILGGAIWALIPALFKAFFKTNETLFTLMMNYAAMGIITCFVRSWNPEHGTLVGLTKGIFGNLFGYAYIYNIIVVLIIMVAMFFYIKYTKHGYEINVVGESENTAKYIGISVKKVIIRTVILSGAICGIIGWLIVAGADKGISSGSAGGRGFTGVLIAWLGNFNPFYMLLMSFLVAFVTRGSSSFASEYLGGNSSFPKISIAVFFFAVLIGEFFLNYEVHFRKRVPKQKAQQLIQEEGK